MDVEQEEEEVLFIKDNAPSIIDHRHHLAKETAARLLTRSLCLQTCQ